MQRKYQNLFVSLAIIMGSTSICVMIFYPSTSELGKGFSIGVIYMLTLYFALISGVIFLVSRLLRLFKWSDSMIYVLFGTLNLLIGLLGVILYFRKIADMQWLHKSLLNLLVGVLMIVDSFLLKYVFQINRDKD